MEALLTTQEVANILKVTVRTVYSFTTCALNSAEYVFLIPIYTLQLPGSVSEFLGPL